MPDILVRKFKGGLFPADDVAKAAMDKLPVGSMMKVTVKQGRNLQRLRLYWSLCAKVAEFSDVLPDREAVHTAFKAGTGRVEYVTLPGTDKALSLYRSIAFDKMEEGEFAEYLDACLTIVWSRILPGWEEWQRAELLNIIGVPNERRAA